MGLERPDSRILVLRLSSLLLACTAAFLLSQSSSPAAPTHQPRTSFQTATPSSSIRFENAIERSRFVWHEEQYQSKRYMFETMAIRSSITTMTDCSIFSSSMEQRSHR
jgi:hypothetical protein